MENRRRGQVILEYFIIFAAIAVVTLIGVALFDDQIQSTLESFVGDAANNMATPNG